MSVNTKMTAIADEIRTLSGTTEAMGLDAMATNVENANSEIDSQADLLSQIVTALEGKTAVGGVELPTLTNEGSAGDMLSGKQLINSNNEVVTGTIQTKTSSNLTANGATVTVPAGYYASQATKSVSTATQVTPSISVSSAGLITASATQTAGYVAAGTKSATKQLTTQAAQTITPGTSNKTIASGRYLTGTQTIKGDANLVAGNIKSGVSIFGVAGTMTAGEDVTTETNAYTSHLTELESVINSLPDAGSGGSGGIQYEIVTIPAGVNMIEVNYSLPRVTAAFGSMNEGSVTFHEEGVYVGLHNNELHYIDSIQSLNGKMYVDFGLDYVEYINGVMRSYLMHTTLNSMSVILVNDPSAEAISS